MKWYEICVLVLLSSGSAWAADDAIVESIGRMPWYDATADTWRPVIPHEQARVSNDDRIGEVSFAGFAMYALLLAALCIMLALIYKMRNPTVPEVRAKNRALVRRDLMDASFAVSDANRQPQDEYAAAYAAGAWGQAVVWLYAWQLRYLDSCGKIRVGPGKSNRMYIHEVRPDQLAHSVLGQMVQAFERSYFGREAVTQAQVDALYRLHQQVVTQRGESSL